MRNLAAKGTHDDWIIGSLKSQEIYAAEKCWIAVFQKEMKKDEKFKHLESQLNLVEEDGLLRCNGWLAEADLGVDTIFLILLPKEGKLIELSLGIVIIKCIMWEIELHQ